MEKCNYPSMHRPIRQQTSPLILQNLSFKTFWPILIILIASQTGWAQDNWFNYTRNLRTNPAYADKLKTYEALKSTLYKPGLDYPSYLQARQTYLDAVKDLMSSTESDSLKLGVLSFLLTNRSITNGERKQAFFSSINTHLFSQELMDNFTSYLQRPKYQIGDTLDITSLYSYRAQGNIPIPLDAEVNLIFFWASWCTACDRYYSPLENLINRHNPSSFQVIGVSLDQTEEHFLHYQKKHNFQFESFSDLNEKWASNNASRFGIQSLPFVIVIDQNGKVLMVDPPAHHLESHINSILIE